MQKKYSSRICHLRQRLQKNNTNLCSGIEPKKFSGKTYKNIPKPYKPKIKQLMDGINSQVRLHVKLAELPESATKSGVSEFLSKWPEEKWLPDVVDKYRKQLKRQVKDLGGD
jgi:hypothetical protein